MAATTTTTKTTITAGGVKASLSFITSAFSYRAYLKSNDGGGIETTITALFQRFPSLEIADFVIGAMLAGRRLLLSHLLSGSYPLPCSPTHTIDSILLAVCREKRFSYVTREDEVACGVLCIQRLLRHASRRALSDDIVEAVFATGNFAYAQCFFDHATPSAKAIFGMIFFLQRRFLPNLQDATVTDWEEAPCKKSAWPGIYKKTNTGSRLMDLIIGGSNGGSAAAAYKNSHLAELWARIERPSLANRLSTGSLNTAAACSRFVKWFTYLDGYAATKTRAQLACEVVLSGTDMAVLSKLVPIFAEHLTGPRLSTLLELRRVRAIEFLARDNLAASIVLRNLSSGSHPKRSTDRLVAVLADIQDEPLQQDVRARVERSGLPPSVVQRTLSQLSFSIHSLRGKWMSLCVLGNFGTSNGAAANAKRVKY